MTSAHLKARWALLLSAALVAACAAASDPARQAEAYLRARADSNVNQMISLSCAAWEPQAKIEATSFRSLNARVEGLACSVSATEANTAFVACAGKIVTSYNGESREVNLADRQFKLANEGGDWRVCGYR